MTTDRTPPADSPSASEPLRPPPPGQEGRYFGARQVEPGQKTHLVHDVFTNVAAKYDLMNDLMSGGVHRLWKDSFVDMVRPRAGETLLDVAGGTGDIAFRMRRRAPGARVLVCDLTEGMVRVGRDRGIDRGDLGGVEWTVGNAEALPFKSRSMDAYTIAFGLRNVSNMDAALAEARRVLRPGGRLFILEFSHVTLPLLKDAYDRFSFGLLPRLGQIVAGDRDSYQYLVESIRRFPEQQALCARLEKAGLTRARYRNLTGGIAAIHSAWRV